MWIRTKITKLYWIYQNNSLLKIIKNLRRPGIEPGSTAWKAAMLTIIPPTHSMCSYLLIQIRNCSCSLYYWKLLFEIIEMIYGRHYGDIKNWIEKNLAERSFDLRTSGLWAQHASTAPLCYHTINTQILYFNNLKQKKIRHGDPYWVEKSKNTVCQGKTFWKKLLSEVGFEPTPTEVDCDLNAAP